MAICLVTLAVVTFCCHAIYDADYIHRHRSDYWMSEAESIASPPTQILL